MKDPSRFTGKDRQLVPHDCYKGDPFDLCCAALPLHPVPLKLPVASAQCNAGYLCDWSQRYLLEEGGIFHIW